MLLKEWLGQHREKDLAPVALTARIARLSYVLRQRMDASLGPFGLDWGQFMVLLALSGHGRSFSMLPRQLHELLHLSAPAISNRLYRLEVKGLVERIVDPADRRRLPVTLTKRGQRTVDRAMSACVETDLGLRDIGQDDLATTFRTLERLRTTEG